MSKFEIIDKKTNEVLETKTVDNAIAFMKYFNMQCDTSRYKYNQVE